MQEKLVEHWLTSANELTYQIPFCEVLVARGHDVLHVSTHGRGEHGKDVVTRDRHGRLCAFQLKGGDLLLSDWRDIRGEVAELVQLPVRVPGVPGREPHFPYLVTNGEIRGDAVSSMVEYRNEWVRGGAPRLRILTKRTLLRWFLDAHTRYLPTALPGFRRFVELFVSDFRDRLPRPEFASLLSQMAETIAGDLSEIRTRRALAAVAVVAGYVAEQYERAGNFISAAEAWTITAATVLGVAERNGLCPTLYQPVLTLVSSAVDRNLDRFVTELLSREHLLEGSDALADPLVYGSRVSLVLGWLSAHAHRRYLAGQPWPNSGAVRQLIRREFGGIRFAGEVDWATVLLLALYVERLVGAADSEALLGLWVAMVLARAGRSRDGVPSPYWLHEKVIRKANGLLAPIDEESFGSHVYTLGSALDMFVRRVRRQFVARVWTAASRLHWCDFRPTQLHDYFAWQAEAGTLQNGPPPMTASWSEWRARTESIPSSSIPGVLERHPEWVPPLLLTYPHRANRTLSGFADLVLSGRRIRTDTTA